MRRMILTLIAVSALVSGRAHPAKAGFHLDVQAAPIFRFQPDGFWLNLHHFLYVLGRAEAQMPDRQRRAVAGAPADQAAGLTHLTEVEREIWMAAVRSYAAGWSKKHTVFDRDLVAVTTSLRDLRQEVPASSANVDASLAAVLDRAGPIYRKVWWPAHRQANLDQLVELQTLVDRHGAAVLRYITRAYQERWPADGYPVNLSAYSNWAGAYSTGDKLLVVSSLDSGTKGMQGLEILFHESMHQWDGASYAKLQKAASQAGIPKFESLLPHAMIFFTAGEAVRSVDPQHVPYAEGNGLWREKGLGAFKPALDSVWTPYLEGKGTLALDDALIALLKAQPPS